MRKLIATGHEYQDLQIEQLKDLIKFFYRRGDWDMVEFTAKKIQQMKGARHETQKDKP